VHGKNCKGDSTRLSASLTQPGRLLGSERFAEKLERTLDRILQKQKPGRKKRDKENWVWCPQNFFRISFKSGI
jgi:hypothetical protein